MTWREPFAELAGTTAVVTGAARGIGLAIATVLHEVGLTVVLVDRDAEELDGAVAGFGGDRAVPVIADLTTEEGHLGIDAALQALPQLSVWVNNAGTVSHQLAEDVDQASFEQVLRINAWGAVRGSQTAFRHMQHDGSRAIVTITSLVVEKTVRERLSYAASKAALTSASRYAAAEWGASGIRVNAVSPGYIETRLTAWPADDPRQVAKQQSLRSIPLARFGQPEDIAAAVLFLASPLASYVTGVTLFVDGGWSLT
jgi:NAD(P)-dependent dehydrogenase (short-subunit alcohol dehydrogenase family)